MKYIVDPEAHWVDKTGIPIVWGMLIPSVILIFLHFYFEHHPIEAYSRDTNKAAYFPGEVVHVTVDAIRSKGGCSSTIRRQLLLNGSVPIGEITTVEVPEKPAGIEPTFIVDVLIPDYAPEGIMTLRTEVTFYCNVIQKWFGGSKYLLNDIQFYVERAK